MPIKSFVVGVKMYKTVSAGLQFEVSFTTYATFASVFCLECVLAPAKILLCSILYVRLR